MMRARLSLMGAAAAMALLGATAPGLAQTLEETLALTYTSNPTLQAERARLRGTQEGVVQARSARLPSVSANASITRQSVESSRIIDPALPPIVSDSDATPKNYSLTANQSVYRGGRTSGAINQADALALAGYENLRTTEQAVFIDAISAFMDVRRDMEVVNIRRNNVEVLSRQLDAARDRFEVGEITRTDVAQAEARLSGARAQFSAAQSQLAASRAAYERVVGQSPTGLSEPPELLDLPDELADAAEIAFANNPQILAAQYNEEAARFGVQVARGALRPEVSLSATARSARDSSFAGDETDSTSITANVSVPIFTGGLNRSRVRAALASEEQARFGVRNARRQVTEGLTNAWNNYQSSLAVIESSEQAVRANEIALDGVQQEAFVGIRTTLDVLDAEQELLESRLTLVTAERDSYVAGFRLLQAMGVLSPETFGLDPVLVEIEGDSWGPSFPNLDLTPWN
jgi:outer membrane protein